MKKLIIFFLLIFSGSTHSQSLIVRYNVTYISDSTNKEEKKTESSYLYIKNDYESIFSTKGFSLNDSIAALHKDGKLSVGDLMKPENALYYTQLNKLVHKNFNEKKAIVYEIISLDSYVYPKDLRFEWKISTQMKNIAGYECIKATTNYAGRKYEAWFTKEVPVSDGPYFFTGLPGLIVSIYDETKSYNFELQYVKIYNGIIIEKPSFVNNAIHSSWEKVFTLRERERVDPLGYMSDLDGIEVKQLTGKSKPFISNNNPLELSID